MILVVHNVFTLLFNFRVEAINICLDRGCGLQVKDFDLLSEELILPIDAKQEIAQLSVVLSDLDNTILEREDEGLNLILQVV